VCFVILVEDRLYFFKDEKADGKSVSTETLKRVSVPVSLI